jgi:hypothetical protein
MKKKNVKISYLGALRGRGFHTMVEEIVAKKMKKKLGMGRTGEKRNEEGRRARLKRKKGEEEK